MANFNMRIPYARWIVDLRWIIGIVAFLIIGFFVLSFYWSIEPPPITQSSDNKNRYVGAASVGAVIESIQILLNKPGGYLSNDIMPPGVLMDDMPSWELGALIQLRDFTRILRNKFSREQAQSESNTLLAKAHNNLNIDNTTWIFPSAEDSYSQAIQFLQQYRARLGEENTEAHFYTRADYLRQWFATMARRLGGLSQKLQLAAGKTVMDSPATNVKGDSTKTTSDEASRQIPWCEADNVFFQARGAAWALLNLSRAVAIDFHDVLKSKNALGTFKMLQQSLEASQNTMSSPVVMTGGYFSIFPNHPLTLAAFVASATNSAINLKNSMLRN